MMWLAWRRQRLQLIVAVGVVAVFAAWLALSGLWDHSANLALMHGCSAQQMLGGNAVDTPHCLELLSRAQSADRWTPVNYGALVALPGVLGLVMGAPLVAGEMAEGTNRLAWTQSIGRTRWLATKLGVTGLICAVLMAVLIPLTSWWVGAVNNLPPGGPWGFSVRGVIVGYVLVAFMLGAALGSLIRRPGWALAAGVPLFVGFRAWVEFSLRPHLAPLVTSAGFGTNNAWIINSGLVPVGRLSPAPGQNWNSGEGAVSQCIDSGDGSYHSVAAINAHIAEINAHIPQLLRQCQAGLKLHQVSQYQPESHFWVLQTAESAVFVGAAAVLLAITVLAVKWWQT